MRKTYLVRIGTGQEEFDLDWIKGIQRAIDYTEAHLFEEIDYDARMKELQIELRELMDQEQESKKALMEVLEGLGYGIS